MTPTHSTFDLDSLTLKAPAKQTKPAWLRKTAKGIGFCKACHTQFGKAELNAAGLCRHCASDAGEAHPINASPPAFVIAPAEPDMAALRAAARDILERSVFEKRAAECVEHPPTVSAGLDTSAANNFDAFRREQRIRAWARDVYQTMHGDLAELRDAPFAELEAWYVEAHS